MPLKKVPVTATTFNGDKVTKTETVYFTLGKPRTGACPECGKFPAHPPEAPHDTQQMYYKYAFYADHQRWPTWKDAMAHCDEATKVAWEAELRKVGVWKD